MVPPTLSLRVAACPGLSLRFTAITLSPEPALLSPDDLPTRRVHLGLPLLDGPVPLSPRVLPGHVGGAGHVLLSLGLRDLPNVGFVVVCPLAVVQLFASPVEDTGVCLYLRLLGLRSGPSPAAGRAGEGERPGRGLCLSVTGQTSR